VKVAKNTVVTLRCQIAAAQGTPIDSTTFQLVYLHGGYENVAPQLEDALEGREAGESVVLTMAPEDAFGEVDAELVRQEPRSAFPPGIQIGMTFGGGNRPTYDEDTVDYRVVAYDDEYVILDGNHPMAGKTLHVTCVIGDVRAATQEEIEAGRSQ